MGSTPVEPEPAEPAAGPADDGGTVRVTPRLPDAVEGRTKERARHEDSSTRGSRRADRPGDRITGHS